MSSRPLLPSVLIVDDSDTDRYILRRMLERSETTERIFEATNGAAGLELLKGFHANDPEGKSEECPAIVFLDINMPVMNGFEFLDAFAELRQEGACRSVVLVMFTSSTHPDDRAAATRYDFVHGYLTKMPASPDALRELVSEALAASTEA